VTSTTRTHQTRTASITPTAQTPAGGVQQSAPSVGGTGTDLHGRCLGNSGNGWGNGGPRDADHHARAGHRRDGNEPPGLAACGDGDSDGNADGD
jgi:hypothetical protein